MTSSPAQFFAQFFVDGQFRTADNIEPVVEAATGEPLGDGACVSESDIDAAVAAARRAAARLAGQFTGASRRNPDRDGRCAEGARQATSELVTRENGMPITLSRGANGAFPPLLLRYYAQLVTEIPVEEIRPGMTGHTIVRREAVGVVAAIMPWNYPQALAAMKVAPALAAGCTVVLKASPETALDALVFAEAAVEAGLPPGVLNVVSGGPAVGACLVAHPGVDKVAFTGSTATGRLVAEICGRLMRPVTLELGGKSAAIILDDADLDATMRGLRNASFVNNGQTCHLSSRILAPKSRYDEIVDAVAALADEHDGRRPTGPGHRDRPHGQLAATRAGTELHRRRQGQWRQVGRRRVDSQGAAAGLVRVADSVRRRRQLRPAGARGDLRPGADHQPVRQR